MSDPGQVDRITRVSALITAVAAAVGSIVTLINAVKPLALPLVGLTSGLTPWSKGGVVVGLWMVAVLAFRHWRKRPMPQPPPTNTVPVFYGRERETENLLTSSANHALVFLVGESGVGKSTLVRHAVDVAKEGAEQPPTGIIQFVGDDWIVGIESHVANFVAKVCPTSNEIPATTPWWERASKYHTAQRTPLRIVFDGFDDYTVRYLPHLFDEANTRFLHPAELRQANPFWDRVARLATEGAVHCVFVTRSDAYAALAAFRFRDPEELTLTRLPRNSATSMLESLVTTAGNWTALRDQILDDLDETGGVLPAQVVSAAAVVRTMRVLTLAEYRKRGGLLGLEVERLEGVVRRAAQARRVSVDAIRRALDQMVDGSSNPPKARIIQATELAPLVGDAVTASDIENVMKSLETEAVVRKIISEVPDEATHAWILQHDYTARIVKAMNRRVDRATADLAERYLAATSSRSLWDKWQALLPVLTQLRLAFRRVSKEGRITGFRYGKFRRFAIASTLKLAVYVGLAAFLAYWRSSVQSDEHGRGLFTRLAANTGALNQDEIATLVELRNSSAAVRAGFLRHAFELPQTAATYARRADLLTHTLVGFDGERRAEMLSFIDDRCVNEKNVDLRMAVACVRIGLALEADTARFWTFAIHSMFRRIAAVGGPADVPPLASEWLPWLLPNTPPAPLRATINEAFWTDFAAAWTPTPSHAAALDRDDRQARDVLSSLEQLIALNQLQPSKDIVVPLLRAMSNAHAAPAALRVALAWRLAVLDPQKAAPELAPLLLQLGAAFGVFTREMTLPDPDRVRPVLPGTAALFRELMVYAAAHESDKRQLVFLLDGFLNDAPIETDEIPALRAALSKLDPPAPPANDTRDTDIDDHRAIDEKRRMDALAQGIARVTPELTKLGRADIAAGIHDFGEKWLRVDVAKHKSNRTLFIDAFWNATNGNLPMCVLTAALMADDDEKWLLDVPWNDGDKKESWFHACVIAGKTFGESSDESKDDDAPSEPSPGKLEDVLQGVVDGHRDPNDLDVAMAISKGVGKVSAGLAVRVIDVAVSRAVKTPDQLHTAVSLLDAVLEHTDNPAAAMKHLIAVGRATEDDATLGAVVQLIASVDDQFIAVDGLSELVERTVKRMQADVQALGLSRSVARMCRSTDKREVVARQVAGALIDTKNLVQFDALRPCFVALATSQSAQSIIDVLRRPICIGDCRKDMIQALSDQSGKRSGTTFWAVQRWAAEQHLLGPQQAQLP